VTTVYRMQDGAGRGPFKPGFTDTWLEDRTNDEYEALKPAFKSFPGILWQMHQLSGKYHCACGCLSLDQLRLWFTPSECVTLSRHGYTAVEMEADLIIQSDSTQCVFARKRAIRRGFRVVKLYELEGTQ